MTELKTINPMRGKGFEESKQYLAREQVKDELNYIDIGLLVLDENGDAVRDVEVKITTPDKDQDKTLTSTGNVYTEYVNGRKKRSYYYPFHYEFKTPGDHVITFESQGKQAVVGVVGVVADERE